MTDIGQLSEKKLTQLIVTPCPFCGSKNVGFESFTRDGLGDYEPEHHFVCDCEVIIIVSSDVTPEEAVKIYNKRKYK